MLKFKLFSIIFAFLYLSLIIPPAVNGCTSAVISDSASMYGVPILWKNRDTRYLSNKIIFVDEKPYCFIALVNAGETSGRFVYAGLNSEGFAIINTVAYNLPKVENEVQDLEGQIMSDALRTCSKVEDFEQYLKKNLGESLGSWSTFSVIDSNGDSSLFEVHNNGYKRFDTSGSEKKYFIVTNFARSGEDGKGEGYLRFEQTTELFLKIPYGRIDHTLIFRNIARDFGNPLVHHPDLKSLRQISSSPPLWIHSRNCINRPSTAAAVVITGRKRDLPHSIATLWVALGEPVTSIAVPVWVESRSSPAPLHEGDAAPICREALRIKKIIHPFEEGSKKNYMKVSMLSNSEGTGFLETILKTENEIFIRTSRFLETSRTSGELAEFQSRMAMLALEELKKIR